jgi:hypothetical protein
MIPSQKQTIGLLVAVALFILGCKPSETTPAATDRIALGASQSARLGSNVSVRVHVIQDSRCPANLTCIWGGEAKVSLALSKSGDSHTLELILGRSGAKRSDSTQIALSGKTYKVILREVNPYPVSPATGPPPTAVIQVTKL